MEKKPSWDDIPSLRLDTDQETTEKNSSEQRVLPRLSAKEVQEMLLEKVDVIYIHVATKKGMLKQKGVLRDINQTGMKFIMPTHPLQQGEMIRLGTVLGQFTFKTKAKVQWKTNDLVGVKFIEPKKEDITYLTELYTAKILNRL